MSAKKASKKRRERARMKRDLIVAAACVVLVAAFGLLFVRGDRQGKPAPADVLVPLPTAEAEPTPAPPEETPQPEPTPEPTPIPTPEPTEEPLRSATIRCIGDLVIHDEVLQGTPNENGVYDFSSLLELIAPAMGNADYTVANVDGAVTGKPPYKGYPNFNTPKELIGNLKDAGVDMLTLANNHILDYYFDGLKSTIACCREYGMDYVGAARSQKEHDTPKVVIINGISVGMLNYTQYLNGMDTVSDPAATLYGVNTTSRADYQKDVSALKTAGADVVVAFLHWGKELEHQPDSFERGAARDLTAAGVDIIIGGHPHYLQPIQYVYAEDARGNRRKCLCVYSLGNFLADSKGQSYDTGAIFEFTVREQADGSFAIESPKYVPTYLWRVVTNGTYVFRVVPSGQYLSGKPPRMTDYAWDIMKKSYQFAVNFLGRDIAQPVAE